MNLPYSAKCNQCEDEGKHESYFGEMGKNLHIRRREHYNDYRNENKKSWMLKHMQKDHNTDAKNVAFTWNVLGKFRKPMRRQLTEAIHIEKAGKNALNLKNEYFKVNMKPIKLSNKEEEYICNKYGRTFEDGKSLMDHKRGIHDRFTS